MEQVIKYIIVLMLLTTPVVSASQEETFNVSVYLKTDAVFDSIAINYTYWDPLMAEAISITHDGDLSTFLMGKVIDNDIGEIQDIVLYTTEPDSYDGVLVTIEFKRLQEGEFNIQVPEIALARAGHWVEVIYEEQPPPELPPPEEPPTELPPNEPPELPPSPNEPENIMFYINLGIPNNTPGTIDIIPEVINEKKEGFNPLFLIVVMVTIFTLVIIYKWRRKNE